MPTTTNFGWTTPADTDLVKDGAAAIRTLAGNIDTSLVDLKGGTTGQVLSKASNTDLDFTFTTVAAGAYTELASGSLSGTLDLQSISGLYRKLSLQLIGYSMSANANIDIRLNNDSGTNYSYAQMYNSTTIYKEINQTSIYAAANNAAETGGQVIFEIENYAANCKHSGIAYNFADDTGNWNFTYWGWNNSAAVNRIQAIPQSGTFDAGTYVLYGVK